MLGRRYAYVIRTSDTKRATDNLCFTIFMTLGVMTLEDVPQLVLNCIYLASTGFGGGGGIAEFSFVMSLLSITSNAVLLYVERNRAISSDAKFTTFTGFVGQQLTRASYSQGKPNTSTGEYLDVDLDATASDGTTVFANPAYATSSAHANWLRAASHC